MKHLVLTIIGFLSCVNLFAQTNNTGLLFYFKVDSTYVMVNNNNECGFMLEFKADTLFQIEDNRIIYDNRKLLQIKTIPFSEIISNPKRTTTIPKALEAFKKWELDYQQKVLKTKLKNGQEFYYRDNSKPFLIWWFKNPPEDKNSKFDYDEKEYYSETDSLVEIKTLNVTHMLCLNFSILAETNVAYIIPVFEDENLKEEIEKLKKIANSVRVYGSGILGPLSSPLLEKTSVLYRHPRTDTGLSIRVLTQDSIPISGMWIKLSILQNKSKHNVGISDEYGQWILNEKLIDNFDKKDVLIHASLLGYTETEKRILLERGYDYIIRTCIPDIFSGTVARGNKIEIRQLNKDEISIGGKTKLKKISNDYPRSFFHFAKDVKTL